MQLGVECRDLIGLERQSRLARGSGLDRRTKPILAVDMDQDGVRIVEAAPSPQGPVLKWGATVLDPSNGKPYRQAAVEGLRELVEAHGIRTRQVHTFLSGPNTVALQISLPPMPPDETSTAVRWAIQRAVPFPLEEAILNYHPLDEQPAGQERHLLVAAARRSDLQEHLTILREAGLIPVHVSILPLVLWNLLKTVPTAPEETTVFVVVQPHLATVAFFRGDRFQLVRALTRSDAPPLDDQTGEALLDPLLDEIWLSLAYYQERFPGEVIQRVLLAGASSEIHQLTSVLAKAIDIPVETVNPIEALPAQASETPTPDVAVAMGLLLDPGKIDLLPPEERYSRRRALLRTGAQLAVATLFFGVILGYGIERLALRYQQANLEWRRALPQQLASPVEQIHQWEQITTSLRTRLAPFEAPITHTHRWLGALKALSASTSPAIALTGLKPEGKQGVQITGLAFADRREPEAHLAEFVARLSQSPYFSGVHLTSSQEEAGYPQRTLTFKLLLNWR
ncbi:MAG: pilus assembly protein PilM [Candidatus Methylomirabilales bacterium]